MSDQAPIQDDYNPGRPWGARRPQSLFISLVFIALAVALVWQALQYIGQGVGGAIPFFLIIAGPLVAGFYIWYFNFRDFEAEQEPSSSD